MFILGECYSTYQMSLNAFSLHIFITEFGSPNCNNSIQFDSVMRMVIWSGGDYLLLTPAQKQWIRDVWRPGVFRTVYLRKKKALESNQ